MSQRRSIVFLMPDTPKRALLWTPDAQILAESLNMDVHFTKTPISPEAVQGADAIITSWGSPRINADYLDASPNLKIIGHAAGSIQAILTPEIFKRGIPIVSANSELARSVAQWSLMMTMIAARKMLIHANFGTHKALQWYPPHAPTGMHNLTVGIWGYGAIARELIRLLHSVGVKQILITDDYLKEDDIINKRVTRVDLPELFEQSDVVHLLTSLTAERVGKVNADLLRKLADNSALILAGRAHLVDEAALMNELISGRLHAYIDVHYQEPLPENHPLQNLSNVVLTPHNAGKGPEDLFVSLVLHEFDRCFRGIPLQHEITPTYAAAMTTEYHQMGNSCSEGEKHPSPMRPEKLLS